MKFIDSSVLFLSLLILPQLSFASPEADECRYVLTESCSVEAYVKGRTSPIAYFDFVDSCRPAPFSFLLSKRYVRPEYRGKKISTALIAKLLEEVPGIGELTGTLSETNLSVYREKLKSLLQELGHTRSSFDALPKEARNDIFKQAFTATPVYRSLKSLGFEFIDLENSEFSFFGTYFVVRKK